MIHTLTIAGSLLRDDGANIPLDLANGDLVAFLDSGESPVIETDKDGKPADRAKFDALAAEHVAYLAHRAEQAAKAAKK